MVKDGEDWRGNTNDEFEKFAQYEQTVTHNTSYPLNCLNCFHNIHNRLPNFRKILIYHKAW